jgi:hypothetical protein
MGTRDAFPGSKGGRGMMVTTLLVPRLWMSRSYTSSPPCTSIDVLCGTALHFFPVIRYLSTNMNQAVAHQFYICVQLYMTIWSSLWNSLTLCSALATGQQWNMMMKNWRLSGHSPVWDFRFSRRQAQSLESSRMQHHVVKLKLTDISEVHTGPVSIISPWLFMFIFHLVDEQ